MHSLSTSRSKRSLTVRYLLGLYYNFIQRLKAYLQDDNRVVLTYSSQCILASHGGNPRAGAIINTNNQRLDFHVAKLPRSDRLIAGSLRVPLISSLHANTSVPLTAIIGSAREAVHGTAFIENDQNAWLNIPLPPSALRQLQRRRRILRLRVLLSDSVAVDTKSIPHVLTYHRNTDLSDRLKRRQRDVLQTDAPTDGDISKKVIFQKARLLK